MFKFDIDLLNGDKELGQGEHGRVFVYETPNTDRKCAVKMVRARNIEELRMFIEELVLSFNHSHSAILPITGFHIDEEKPKGWTIYMRMQLMTKNLRKLIEEHKKDNSFLSKDDIVEIFHALASGFEYLFSRNIVHRDIKPENILLDEAHNVKIGDIGIAKFKSLDDITRTMMSMKGTPTYMAPELFQPDLEWSQENLCKADVWSLGVTIMELCLIECEKIFPHLHISEKAKIVERNLEKVKKKYGRDLSSILADLVRIEPVERKSFENIAKTLRESYPSVVKIKEQNYSMSSSYLQELESRVSELEQEVEDNQQKINDYEKEQENATRRIKELETRASELEQAAEEKKEKINEYQTKIEKFQSQQLMNKNINIWMWVVLIAFLVFNTGNSMNLFNRMWSEIKQATRLIPDQANDGANKLENVKHTPSSQTHEEPETSEIESIGEKDDKHQTLISLSNPWIQIISLSAFVPLAFETGLVFQHSSLWQFAKIGLFLSLISAGDILYSFKEDYQNIGHLTGILSFIVHLLAFTANIVYGLMGILILKGKFHNPSSRQNRFIEVCCIYITWIMISGLINLLLNSTTLIYVVIQLSLNIAFFIFFFRERRRFSRTGRRDFINIIFYIPCVVFLFINLTLMGIMLFCSGSNEFYATSVTIGDIVAKLSFVPFIFISSKSTSQS